MRRSCIVCLVGLSVILTATVPAGVKQPGGLGSADQLREEGQYAEAETAYQQLAKGNPGTEVGLAAESGLALLYAQTGKDSLFAESRARLVAEYSGRPEFRRALCTIGDNLRWRGLNPQAARQMYTLAAAGEPYPDLIWARMGLAISCIRLKDYEAAGPVVESLWADSRKDERLGQALCHIGDAYRDRRRHADARRLYQYVVNSLPNDEYALWSQAGLAISAIDAREEPAARAAIEKLRANHARRPDFAAALAAIADNYRWRSAHAEACALYRLATRTNPNHAQGLWFQMGLAISSIATGDPNTAQACLTRLHERYRADPGLPQALYEIAYAFSNDRQYDEAVGLFNEVIASWPESDYALLSRVGLGLVQVRQGNDAEAEVAYQKILTDAKDDAKLIEALHLMAEGYYTQALGEKRERLREKADQHYRAALGKWQRLLEQFPATPYYTPSAQHFSGECYQALGEVAKTLEWYQKVCDGWPDYEYTWHLQFMIAKLHKNLLKTGAVSPAQADAKIEAALAAVVQKYPDCPAAKAAGDWRELRTRLREGGEP